MDDTLSNVPADPYRLSRDKGGWIVLPVLVDPDTTLTRRITRDLLALSPGDLASRLMQKGVPGGYARVREVAQRILSMKGEG